MNELRARLGARVRELRKAQRMTQERLAERAGLSYKFVGEIERGAANPTVDTLSVLSRALEVDVGELFVPSSPALGPTRYTISERDVRAVREAFESVDEVLERMQPVIYPRRRRRRPRRSQG